MKGRIRLEKRRKNGLTVEGEGAAAADGVWRRQGLEDVVQGEKTQAESWRTKGRSSSAAATDLRRAARLLQRSVCAAVAAAVAARKGIAEGHS